MKINTDAKKIEQILTRGVENIYPNKDFLEEKLKSGECLTLYTGYDPTASTLHIGHGITLLKLRQFQELGHKVIMLIGDFTGMIGDPTDKSSARQKLTREEVLKNCKQYKKQSASVINWSGKNSAQLKYNSKWLAKLNFAEVVELTSNFTVQRMLERDMFERRMKEEKPIYLHEFLYPLMQGYDSVAMDVDGEVGGNDQTFNMLAGRDLMKTLKNKDKFVLTTKLLADETGKKMGKSEGNMIALTDTAEDMFGKVMSWSDEMILLGFELTTSVTVEEINQIGRELNSGANPRDYKLRLAYEVVRTFLGDSAASKGKDFFKTVIQSKEAPTQISEIKPSDYEITTLLVESNICKSKSEVRRVIDEGGVKINDEKVESGDYFAKVKSGDIIKKGNRWFVKVV